MHDYIAEMVDTGRVSWERLVTMGLVAADSIDGTTDARWLIGDDMIFDADRRVLEARPDAWRVEADSAGLFLATKEDETNQHHMVLQEEAYFKAAEERDGLKAVNADLVAALEALLYVVNEIAINQGWADNGEREQARAAIARAKDNTG